ncbi:MAG TPA: hypothetical protein VLY03_07435 [Bacteroidota bacterium]|nr:hypothetical protein [Bacteroidota bacterium]
MISKETALESIQHELETAREALDAGNNGKVRVCARRAVGHAISWMLTRFPKPGWPADAMGRIHLLSGDPSLPDEVRHAALRLTRHIDEHFGYAPASDPLADARLIIRTIINIMDSGDR